MQAPTLTDRQDPDPVWLCPRAAGGLDHDGWPLEVRCRDDDGALRAAGQVTLRPRGYGAADLEYELEPWARGRGVASRAVRMLLEWAFTDEADGGGGLDVVLWQVDVGNWPARRVAWACGLRVEGVVRGLCERDGARHDGWVGSIVRGDDLAPGTTWREAVPLSGERVVLRPWDEYDAARVAQACADPLTQYWLPNLPAPYTLADAQWYVRSREEEHARGAGIYWCLADPYDDRCLGSLGLMNLLAPLAEPEIGYWLHPDAHGRGVMSEAVRLVVRHALLRASDGGLGFDRVVLRAAAGNTASRRVAQAAGLREYGVAHRLEKLPDGQVDDLVLHEVLADALGSGGAPGAGEATPGATREGRAPRPDDVHA